MFELIRADLARKMRGFGVRPEDQTFFRKRITPFLEFGTFAVIVYRFGSWAYTVKIPVIRQILITLYLFINVFCMAITGIHIARENKIGPGLSSITSAAFSSWPKRLATVALSTRVPVS